METTKNCGLKKPGQDDFYDVQDFDDNMEIIDEHIGALESPAYDDAKKLAELESGEKYTTAWGKLKKAVSALIAHLSDKVSHITAEERTAWNAKLNADVAARGLRVWKTDWSTEYPESVWIGAYLKDGYIVVNGTTIKGKGYETKCGRADRADRATNASYTDMLTVIKPDWNGRYSTSESNVYCIHGGDDRLWMGGSLSGKGKEMAVQFATNAANVKDSAHAWTATEISNYFAAKMPLSGGNFTGNVSMQKHDLQDTYAIYAISNDQMQLLANGAIRLLHKNWGSYTDAIIDNLHYQGSLVKDSYRGVKENISPATEDRIRKILDIPVEVFDYRPGFGGGQKDVLGMIVDEVQNVIPEAVYIPEDWDESEFNELLGDVGNKEVPGLDKDAFVPYLIGMVQLMEKEITELKKEITELRKG